MKKLTLTFLLTLLLLGGNYVTQEPLLWATAETSEEEINPPVPKYDYFTIIPEQMAL